MSNQAVGNVYQTIIDEVINSSRVDFEESGVEESVLEELRQVSRPFHQPFFYRTHGPFHANLSFKSMIWPPISCYTRLEMRGLCCCAGWTTQRCGHPWRAGPEV